MSSPYAKGWFLIQISVGEGNIHIINEILFPIAEINTLLNVQNYIAVLHILFTQSKIKYRKFLS